MLTFLDGTIPSRGFSNLKVDRVSIKMSSKDNDNVDASHVENDDNIPESPEPSHMTTGQYVALMETSEKECESWYFFIRLAGNGAALRHLQQQLEQVEWYIFDNLSTFDLDLDHIVSAITAKQMTKLELNSHSFHRKFDGKLQKIDLGFRKRDGDERKMEKTFDLLGYGQIEDYIDDEDLDPEDLTDHSSGPDNSGDTSDGSGNTSDNSGDTSDDSKDSESSDNQKGEEKPSGIPPALLNSDRPRWAKARGLRKKKKRT